MRRADFYLKFGGLVTKLVRCAILLVFFCGLTLKVHSQTIAKLTLSPSSVVGAKGSIGRVFLTGKAGSKGIRVSLSSSNAIASVPASVTVPEGSISSTFSLTTTPVVSSTTVVIKGSVGSRSVKATFEVTAPSLVGIDLNPAIVGSATQSSGTVHLNAVAPVGGVRVAIHSNSMSASVPSLVVVPSGSDSSNFLVTTANVSSKTTVSIRATLASISKTAQLTIKPLKLVSVVISPSAIDGGNSSSGTVMLSTPVLNPTVILLTSDNQTVAVPDIVTVPPGAHSAKFNVSTSPVTQAISANIFATLGDQSVSSGIKVMDSCQVSSLSAPTTVMGGSLVPIWLYLVSPAGPGGAVVSLSSSNPAISVPETVMLEAGATEILSRFTSANVSSATVVTIKATTGSSSKSVTVLVDPAFNLTYSSPVVIGGNQLVGTIHLGIPAPIGGVTFSLSSETFNAKIYYPSSVTVPAGAISADFTIQTTSVPYNSYFNWISVTDSNGEYVSPDFEIDSGSTLSGFGVSSACVYGGSKITITARLNSPAPPGGTIVSLSTSTNNVVTVPATMTIPAGQTSAIAVAVTSAVSTLIPTSISGYYNGITSTARFAVSPALPGTTYTLLNSDGSTQSFATGLFGKFVGGNATFQNNIRFLRGGFWSGSAASFIDLTPSDWPYSNVAGISGNVQVGSVSYADAATANWTQHAALWSSTSDSFIDLNPPGSLGSIATGVSGQNIVGNFQVPSQAYGGNYWYSHAGIWKGTSHTLVDLTPDGPSSANAVDGNAVVGAVFGAALWTDGTPESFVSLHPAGWTISGASGVSGNTQVGWVLLIVGGTRADEPPTFYGPYASSWTGSSSSFVNLNPLGAESSSANAVANNLIVGNYSGAGNASGHACLWSGSTVFDLQAAVGGTWTSSTASAIYRDSTGIYVAGQCDAGAILWHIPDGDLPRKRPVSHAEASKP